MAIYGASGGIGAAFANQLAREDWVSDVFLFSRSGTQTGKIGPKLTTTSAFDIRDEASIEDTAKLLANRSHPLRLVFVATGKLHSDDGVGPERDWSSLDPAHFQEMMMINTIGPALIAKHTLPLLSKEGRAVFAAISARVGSISDNRLGGWYSYRASKAALNMTLKTLSIELRRKNRDAICLGLHPGTVATNLSKPFQKGVKPEKLFTPDHSAQSLMKVIKTATPQQSGTVLAYDGAQIPS